ncbi:hypothetical protein GGQ97_001851 [Sphingomonas kaistensis]|uniref:Uncharacterized protein n=1 Tax=Sphingomonas kaistensis TaxID=298708 RepID=A0A7X5Y6F0_9SPHN|nr:hypothetical protein [Sphingomonas kaistensis]NJC06058.1 hypothetical protein [Sphingomonas kaistensis]
MILAAAAAAALASACAPGPADKAWIHAATAAWRLQLRRLPELTPPADVTVILFDARCRLESRQALQRNTAARWTASRHDGQVLLADGTRIPATVTSFAGEGKQGGPTFVMALPSLWAAGKIPGGSLGLDRLTRAVLLHEASHVAQTALFERLSKLPKEEGLPEDFSDDSIQQQFEENVAFSASVEEETRLLFAAAAASDDKAARALAGQALAKMKARRARWFVGEDRRLGKAEDLFLSMEGAGQYVGYSWLIDPKGGALSTAEAMSGFGTRSKWWSQKQGLALILAVERLELAGWREQVWKTPHLIGVELLEAAVARSRNAS